MPLVPSIMLKRKKTLLIRTVLTLVSLATIGALSAQNNSPYSRYGVGDQTPSTHIVNRAMGGVATADADFLHINFSNPASYSAFQVGTEARSKKIISGRVLLDAGINFESRTLREPNNPLKFTATDLYFSYVQIGIPLRKGWGLSFGLRPLSRIGYKIDQNKRINNIDSSIAEYEGSGGTYLPTIGTGFAIKNFSAGVNIGYLFGRRETSTAFGLVNDTVQYYDATYRTSTSFGSLYANAGLQYTVFLDKEKRDYLRLGATGSMKQTLKATQDQTIGTFIVDPTGIVDTVYSVKGNRGEVIYPASYSFGVMAGGSNARNGAWQLGADVIHTAWSDFRFYGAKDAVESNTQIRVGGSLRPDLGRNYFSAVTYRAGFYAGSDYITAGGKLPAWGASVGFGLPIANYSRLSQQYTVVNLALEYNKRGNNDNPLKENMFRLSVGLNFSDFWFNKRKYD
ncbi:MAG: hypothetical protein JWP69_1191 [Flaviaesturariibacter sp.]|nr:hypothetical protein [Flaviaesturariibacter sp.]